MMRRVLRQERLPFAIGQADGFRGLRADIAEAQQDLGGNGEAFQYALLLRLSRQVITHGATHLYFGLVYLPARASAMIWSYFPLSLSCLSPSLNRSSICSLPGTFLLSRRNWRLSVMLLG